MTDTDKPITDIERVRLAADYLNSNNLKMSYEIILPLIDNLDTVPGLRSLYALLVYNYGCLAVGHGDIESAIMNFNLASETDASLEKARTDLAICLNEWDRINPDRIKLVHGWWMPVTDLTFSSALPSFGQHSGRHVFEMQHIEFIINLCQKKRRAIDIGGHIGSWSWVLSDYFQNVDSFEPNPIMQKCFRKNVGHQNVLLHPEALGRDEGMFGFVAGLSNTGTSHIAKADEIASDTVIVKRLDSYNFENVDFIKMDAEGFESFIIDGAIETIRSNRPVIFIEVNRCSERYGVTSMTAVKALEGLGAKVYGHAPDGNYVLKWDN